MSAHVPDERSQHTAPTVDETLASAEVHIRALAVRIHCITVTMGILVPRQVFRDSMQQEIAAERQP